MTLDNTDAVERLVAELRTALLDALAAGGTIDLKTDALRDSALPGQRVATWFVAVFVPERD